MKNKSLLLILLLGLILRLGVNIYLGLDAPPDLEACGDDAVQFERLAWNVASGNGYVLDGRPTAFRAPGFPFVISFIYMLFGRSFLAFHVFYMFIGTACCYITYLLVQKIANTKTALWAAFIYAVMPLQIYYTGHYLSEILAIFFNLLTTYTFVSAVSRKEISKRLIFCSGLLNGLSMLVRPIALFYMIFLGVAAVFWSKQRFSRILSMGLIFFTGMFIIVAPWSFRNYKTFDRLSLVASNGGSTFWGANNEIVADINGNKWGSWISTNFAGDLKKREVLSLDNEIDRDQKEWALGKKFLKENKEKIPVLLLGKYYRLASPIPLTDNRLFMILVLLGYLGVVPLFIYGGVLSFKDKDHFEKFYPVIAQFFVILFCTGIFYGSYRFRAGYEPFFIIYAAIAVCHLQNHIPNIFKLGALNEKRT